MGGIVQFSTLGHFGRFGNQLFQYAFAKAYAEKVGAVLETPPWVGQLLFEGISDPPLSRSLPTVSMDSIPPGQTDINLFGYYQFAEALQSYERDWVRKLFTLKPEWTSKFPQRAPLVGHLRRGDYLSTYQSVFCTVHEVAYRRAMEKFGFNPDTATWVSDQFPTQFGYPGLEWFGDFMTLYNAQVLFRANSTFSWWAGTLGPEKQIFSPDVAGKTGPCSDVPFVQGNHPRCCDQSNVSDFRLKGER